MTADYYVTFGALQCNRQELVEPLTSLLFEMQAVLELECDPLVAENGILEYTFDRVRCTSLLNAIESTQQFSGLEFNFVFCGESCSFLIWNDSPDSSTVSFCQPKSAFAEQQDDAEQRNAFVRLLIRFMEVLDAPFCKLESEAGFVTPSESDAKQWLAQVGQAKSEKWALVISRESAIPQTAIPEQAKSAHCFVPVESIEGWLLSLMGDVDLEK